MLDLYKTQQQDGSPAWTETDRTIGGYISYDGPEATDGDRGRLFSWHSSHCQVFEEAVGTDADGISMTALAERTALEKSTLTRMLDRMEAEGMLRREPGPDRRGGPAGSRRARAGSCFPRSITSRGASSRGS